MPTHFLRGLRQERIKKGSAPRSLSRRMPHLQAERELIGMQWKTLATTRSEVACRGLCMLNQGTLCWLRNSTVGHPTSASKPRPVWAARSRMSLAKAISMLRDLRAQAKHYS